MFEKILIANRGEIACRIIKTARKLGIRTVAVYADADANALHVQMADEAVHIGPSPSSESYLRTDKIIAAAKACNARAIHPGYGFLSENAGFARQCVDNDIVFIGPKAETIEKMGSKSAAKQLMEAHGVPTVPGYQEDDQSKERLTQEADRIGYPVLLKASAGGGGKGMRLVEQPGDFASSLESAKREAEASFGDDRMLIEKYLPRARHVEVQVFGDSHGNIVHLFERDCSIQRRHQKVIEEAPAPDLKPTIRKRLLEAGVAAARAVEYIGAGTVEFLFDGEEGIFFMEMNTRLQVEHPVTEQITGLDLVEWQLRVAAGEKLSLTQSQITSCGHALEARIYAEDPYNEFLPATGILSELRIPAEGVRIDSGVNQGDTVTPYYDPMIAKVTVHGKNRAEAVSRLDDCLSQTRISGVETNTQFLGAILKSPDFAKGNVYTRFIDDRQADLFHKPDLGWAPYVAAILWERDRQARRLKDDGGTSPWDRLTGWRLNQPTEECFWFLIDGKPTLFSIRQKSKDAWLATIDVSATSASRREGVSEGSPIAIEFSGKFSGGSGDLTADGQRMKLDAAPHKRGLRIWFGQDAFDVTFADPFETDAQGGSAEGSLVAPMPGVVISVLRDVGDSVSAGEPLLILEAMKMEHTVKAPCDGKVMNYRFNSGDQVKEGELLVEFEEAS